MIILSGDSLGKRQQELNEKVKVAVKQNITFNELKNTPEVSDVDKLFKIDVASKYKNIDYILEVVKGGDSLYISRALKSSWIYDDEFSFVINTDYLHHNVFLFMSNKMKKKFLTALSSNLRNESRASSFCDYCFSSKLDTNGRKFLFILSEKEKMEYIKNKFDILPNWYGDHKFFPNFIGNSLNLAEAFLKKSSTIKVWYQLRYLYSVDNERYLNILENNVFDHIHDSDSFFSYKKHVFGLRMSKDILTKHKEKVLKRPKHYIMVLNNSMIKKHSSVSDAKIYLKALLNRFTKSEDIWNQNYFKMYDHIISLIPIEERFQFMKAIVSEKFPGDEFETSLHFYDKAVFKILMTTEQQENWALQHLESGIEIHGTDRNYIWYKFINFKKSFIEIKKIVIITKDKSNRLDMLTTLLSSAKNNQEIETLLNYFYEKHVNEDKLLKETFIDQLIEIHNVFEFDDNCWIAFYNILCSMKVHNAGNSYDTAKYKFIVLVYHIIHDKELPDGMKRYVADPDINMYILKKVTSKLNKNDVDKVYKYVLHVIVNNLYDNEAKPYSNLLGKEMRPYINAILSLIHQFKKTKDDVPEVAMKFIKLDWDTYNSRTVFHSVGKDKITEGTLLRLLKKDTKSLIKVLPNVQKQIDSSFDFRINTVLKKLKIYFSNDYAKEFLVSVTKVLYENKDRSPSHSVFHAVNAIFRLADDNFKIEFLAKHVPANPKIDHRNIKQAQLTIQEAICRFVGYSRPPLPLTNVLLYIKGDYVRFCLPLFGAYYANLPLPQCLKFVEALLNCPLSVQKHGLRLAFKCFGTEHLCKLVKDVWSNTRNVSLRMILYQSLYDKIKSEESSVQNQLFEAFNAFSADIHESDTNEIMELLLSDRFPEHLIGIHLETAWVTVSKFPDKSKFMELKSRLIRKIENNITYINPVFLRHMVDDHLKIMLIDKEIKLNFSKETNPLLSAKWSLVARYIAKCVNIEESNELIHLITRHCIEMWYDVDDEVYCVKKVYFKFIDNIIESDNEQKDLVNPLLQLILNELQTSLPITEIYKIVWIIRLSILTKTTLQHLKDMPKEISTRHAVTKSIINHAVDIGKLIKEMVDKGLFFYNFMCFIEYTIKLTLTDFVMFLSFVKCSSDGYKFNFTKDELLVLYCVGLTLEDSFENCLMAIRILPLECPTAVEEPYKNVIDKIKLSKSSEIQCSLYQKFMTTEFKRFKYV